MIIKINKLALLVLAWLMAMEIPALAASSKVEHAPIKAFDIGSFQLGRTTLNDVGMVLGPAPSQKLKDGLVRTLCYFSVTEHRIVAMRFDASVLGGLDRLTSISARMLNRLPRECTRTNVNLSEMQLGTGIAFGQSEEEFKTHIPVSFVRHGAQMVYKAEYQRKMTDEELASMRQQWPEMPSPSFFDVVESIQARFQAGALQSYEVKRTESY